MIPLSLSFHLPRSLSLRYTHTLTVTPLKPDKKAPTPPQSKKKRSCVDVQKGPSLQLSAFVSDYPCAHTCTCTPPHDPKHPLYPHTLLPNLLLDPVCACACMYVWCVSVWWSWGGGFLTNGIQQQGFILKHTDNAFHTYLPQQRWGRWAASYPGLKAG